MSCVHFFFLLFFMTMSLRSSNVITAAAATRKSQRYHVWPVCRPALALAKCVTAIGSVSSARRRFSLRSSTSSAPKSKVLHHPYTTQQNKTKQNKKQCDRMILINWTGHFCCCFVLWIIIGEPVYEAVRPIGANMELIVFYLPGLHDDDEELLYGGLPAVRSLRSSLFRRTMGLILQGTSIL